MNARSFKDDIDAFFGGGPRSPGQRPADEFRRGGPSAGVEAAPATADPETKDTNPKDAIAGDKLPLGLFPATALAAGALALHDGALKYGRSNWRAAGVRASVYHASTLRHLMAWFEGQDNDPDSGLPHLAHALAGLAILVDAGAAGKLTDDRPIAGGYADFAAGLAPAVARLREQHAGRNPQHYTRADGPAQTWTPRPGFRATPPPVPAPRAPMQPVVS